MGAKYQIPIIKLYGFLAALSALGVFVVHGFVAPNFSKYIC